MPSPLREALFIAFLLTAGCAPRSEIVPLFNGIDLSGWNNINGAESTWAVRDGVIVCSGFPTGVLCTDRHYENFVLELEWRHMTEGGNAGLFIHSDPLPSRGQPFTRSIEAQVMDGNHGDVFAIHGATMVPDRPHPRGWMRSLPIEERANPAGEWNHYRVESRDGEVTLAVNGKVVSGGSELNPRQGYICLESEGAEVHFRELHITELPSTHPEPNETADVYRGFVSLYNGIDLSGWSHAGLTDTMWQSEDWMLRSNGVSNSPEGDAAAGPLHTTASRYLWTDSEFRDFVLIADWRMDCERPTDDRSIGGIALRGSSSAEVLIGCEAALSSGRRSGVAFIADDGSSDRGWHRLEITVHGRELAARLNGRKVAEERLSDDVPPIGPIGLVNHGATLRFANLFVKELQ